MEKSDTDWQPMSVAEAAAMLRGAPFRWWIAGGHAIDHALGRPLRSDIELNLLLLRRDQMAVRDFLAEWDCHIADPPGMLRSWPPGESLRHGVHEARLRRDPQDRWRLRLRLDDIDGDRWRSRRDARITRPVPELGQPDASGIAFLAPEVLLYYRAARPKPWDHEDFEAVLPVLSGNQRAWLSHAIATSWGRQHRWLPRLMEAAKV
jgi:hypothetical protein